MKKLLLFCCFIFLFGCGNQNNKTALNEKQTPPLPDQPKDNTFEYDVAKVSSNFSGNDLIYFIMIDRFHDGDVTNNNFSDFSDDPNDLKSYKGGDFQGIIDKLDYIKSLGTTTLWLTPIVKNEPYGYHGYWTEDFYAVDPHFGDMATFKRLVDEAHKKGMKVILDYVVNHTGYNHPWTSDPDKSNWFHNRGTMTDFNDKDQVENFDLSGLPDLNTENPEVKAYFYDNALWWIKETGVDGMRLDTVRHVPQEFWNEFTYVIKQTYPDFYFLGEVWKNSASLLEEYHQTGIDGLTNYALYNGIENTFKLYGDANTLRIAINNESKFSNPEINGIFIDNHDVARLISRSSKNGQAYLEQALTFIMTYPSIPIIYYGTEIAMTGKDDPNNRQMMDFDTSSPFFDYYQLMVALRNETRGMDQVTVLDSDKEYIVISYEDHERTLITAFNISEKDFTLDLNLEGDYYNYTNQEKIDSSKVELNGLSTLILMKALPKQ